VSALGAVAGLAVSLATGAGLVMLAMPPARVLAERALAAAAAIVAGIAAHALLAFAVCLVTGRLSGTLVPIDLGLAAGACAAGVLSRRRATARPAPPRSPEARPDGLGKAARLLVLAGAGVAAAAVALVAWKSPGGGWDAVANWNLKARILVRATEPFALLRRPELGWPHPDYPPLLPLSVARLWAFGGESAFAPALLAAAFAGATLLAALGAAGALPGGAAILAPLLVLGTSSWFRECTAQGADVPLGGLVATSLALLFAREGRGRGAALLAGLVAGSAPFLKNEGIVFAGAAAAAVAWLDRARLRPFVVGLAPGWAATAWFKLALAGPSYLSLNTTLAGALLRLADPGRWRLVLRAYAGALLGIGGGICAAAVALLLLAGLRPRRPAALAWVPLALLGASQVGIYLVTPLDLAWQLDASVDRVLLQLWPAACALLFLGARFPPLEAPAPGTGQGARAGR